MFAGLVGLRGAQYSTTVKIKLRTRVLRAWFHLLQRAPNYLIRAPSLCCIIRAT